ncbi:MAG: MerC domain-containing protein [Pseudomonadota bacterium]
MQKKLDAIGIGLSGLCIVHCLLMPLVVVALPALAGSTVEGVWGHALLLAIAIPVSVTAFVSGLRSHGGVRPSIIGGLGLLLMTSALLPWWTEAGERAITIIGVVVLASGHFINQRLQRFA